MTEQYQSDFFKSNPAHFYVVVNLKYIRCFWMRLPSETILFLWDPRTDVANLWQRRQRLKQVRPMLEMEPAKNTCSSVSTVQEVMLHKHQHLQQPFLLYRECCVWRRVVCRFTRSVTNSANKSYLIFKSTIVKTAEGTLMQISDLPMRRITFSSIAPNGGLVSLKRSDFGLITEHTIGHTEQHSSSWESIQRDESLKFFCFS